MGARVIKKMFNATRRTEIILLLQRCEKKQAQASPFVLSLLPYTQHKSWNFLLIKILDEI